LFFSAVPRLPFREALCSRSGTRLFLCWRHQTMADTAESLRNATKDTVPGPDASTRLAERTGEVAKQDVSACVEGDVPLCVDQFQWLTEAASRHGLSGPWAVLSSLVHFANGEPPKSKRQLFLVVRCGRCLQHSRGGEKEDHAVLLPAQQWQWLRAVRDRSNHSSVAKTIRIILDFYVPMCQLDETFEARVVACGGGMRSIKAAGA